MLCDEIGHSFKQRSQVKNRALSPDDIFILVIMFVMFITIPLIPFFLWFRCREKISYEICDRCGTRL